MGNVEAEKQPAPPCAAETTAGRRRSSVESAAAAAFEALYGHAQPSTTAPSELRGQILDSVLRRAARDVLVAIPAQRSVIFTHDRLSNLLSVYCSVSKSENESVEGPPADGDTNPSDGWVAFPPTMGMTGACFLQKRCLRMQEPNRHRAFRREYDVPKDMEVDSVICTALTIRHRAIAVIQLLNRLATDSMEAEDDDEEIETRIKPKEGTEDYLEIKLQRAKSIRPPVKTGFTAKDEQKLIHFASHLAYGAEAQLKRVDDNSVTHARIRELQASDAIDLLNILNARLERRRSDHSALVPVSGADLQPASRRHQSTTHEAADVPIELLGVLVAIIRLQARFRAQRVRRSDKFAEALDAFRRQHERVRSVLVLQRVARGCLIRKRVKKQRRAVSVIARVYDHYRFRAKLETSRHAPRPRRRSTVLPLPPGNSSKAFRRRIGAERATERESEGEQSSKALKSATAIQRHVRGHQARLAIQHMTGFSNLGKGLRNLVKLQSFVRGGLARIHFQRAKEMLQLRRMRTPPSVCLRIGLPPASLDPDAKDSDEARTASSSCVYRLPERRGNAHVVRYRSMAPRRRLEALSENQSGRILDRCDEFRREAFVAAVGARRSLPELPGSRSKTRSKLPASHRQAGPLLCCLLPAQPKLGTAFEQAERRISPRASSSTAPSGVLQTIAVPSPPRPAEERP